jgi:hypothetical protein
VANWWEGHLKCGQLVEGASEMWPIDGRGLVRGVSEMWPNWWEGKSYFVCTWYRIMSLEASSLTFNMFVLVTYFLCFVLFNIFHIPHTCML